MIIFFQPILTRWPDVVQSRNKAHKKGLAQLPGPVCERRKGGLVDRFFISLFNQFSGMAEGDHPKQIVVTQDNRPTVSDGMVGKVDGGSQGIEFENGLAGSGGHRILLSSLF